MEHSAFLNDAALLDLCARRGARLDLRDGKLLIKAAPDALSEDERLLVRTRKYSLMRTLARRRAADSVQTAWAERERTSAAVCPLTPWQEIFALLTRQGEHAVVNQTAVLDVHLPCPDPDGHLVRRALQALMERHPMLRMQVTALGDREGQQILPSCPLPLRIVHVQDGTGGEAVNAGKAADARETAVEACRKEFRARACDLTRAPLWQAAFFPAADSCTGILVLGLHHIIMDGWSMGLLARDLARLLVCMAEGTMPAAPPAVTYADYAAWLDKTGLARIRQAQTAWWNDTVHGVPQRHRISTDYLRGTQHGRQTLCRLQLEPEVLQRLHKTAARLDCSLFAALHTALRQLLWRTAGQTHAPVLTVAANRQLAGLEDVVGCFVNVLPLVAPLDPAAPAAESIRQSQACLMEAMEHQMLPFQDIVAAARVRRQHVRHPLSQIFLTLQNAFAGGQTGCVTARLPVEPISAYDLAFLVWDYGDRGCIIHLEYDAGLFKEERMQALLAEFATCIRELCACELEQAQAEETDRQRGQDAVQQDTAQPETVQQESVQPDTAGRNTACQDQASPGTVSPDTGLQDTAQARLARALNLGSNTTVLFAEPTVLDSLLTAACTLSGCTCCTGSSAPAQPGQPVLRILTHWPATHETAAGHTPEAQSGSRPESRSGSLSGSQPGPLSAPQTDVQPQDHLLLVNHLPPAGQLVQAAALAASVRFLVQDPVRGDVLVADAADLASDRDTTLPATLLLSANEAQALACQEPAAFRPSCRPFSQSSQSSAQSSVQSSPLSSSQNAFTDVSRLSSQRLPGRDRARFALPLPGGTSPLLWRHGHAVHLDQLAMQAACVRTPEEADLALGLLVPAHASALSSVVHADGELVAWTGRGFVLDEAHLARLPEALRPRHVMPVDHVPRRSDGTVCRESLLDIPFYSEDFVRRGIPHAWLRTADQRSSAGSPAGSADWLHVPAERPWSMTGLPVAPGQHTGQRTGQHAGPYSGHTCLFASDKPCLVHLSGTSLDSLCLHLLLHSCAGSFLLAGDNADMLCSFLNSPRLAPWQASSAAPVHSAVQIIPEKGPVPQALPASAPGCPCLCWVVFDTSRTDSISTARRAGLFASLCALARTCNAASPHTALVLGMPCWNCAAGTAGQGLTLQRAGELLHTALATGRDMALIGLEPEDIGWKSLHFRTPHPCCELVCTQPVSPQTLPYPLRTAFCETGPLHMLAGSSERHDGPGCPQAQSAGTATAHSTQRPADEHAGGHAGGQAVAQTMAAIWNSILQTENADPNASFFDLGGTSVMAPLMQQRIASAFQVDIGVAGVFLYPSLHELTMVVLTALESRHNAQADTRSSAHMQARQAAARAMRTARKQERKIHVAPLV